MVQVDPLHLPPAAVQVGSHPVELDPPLDDPLPKLEEPLLEAPPSSPPPNVAVDASSAGEAVVSSKGLDDVALPHPAASAVPQRAPTAKRFLNFRVTGELWAHGFRSV
jgi:hypothetical protein